MIVGGISNLHHQKRESRELPWADLGVDSVLIWSAHGAFNSEKKLSMVHIELVRRKMLSAPGDRGRLTVASTVLIRMLRPKIRIWVVFLTRK